MSKVQSALRHHLDQITQAEFVAQVPSHAQDNNLPIKVPPANSPLVRSSLPMQLDPPQVSTLAGHGPFAPEPFKEQLKSFKVEAGK
jgi:hypothetical protein